MTLYSFLDIKLHLEGLLGLAQLAHFAVLGLIDARILPHGQAASHFFLCFDNCTSLWVCASYTNGTDSPSMTTATSASRPPAPASRLPRLSSPPPLSPASSLLSPLTLLATSPSSPPPLPPMRFPVSTSSSPLVVPVPVSGLCPARTTPSSCSMSPSLAAPCSRPPGTVLSP